MSVKHLFLPDTQVRAGVPTKHIEAAGNYISEKRPDVIIHAGDHWDMSSLSGWDSVHKKVKNKVQYSSSDGRGDVESGNEAFCLLNKAISKAKDYHPRKIFILGNHEQRIERFREEFPHLGDAVSYKHLNFEGWKVIPYLKPITIDGIAYCHFFHPPHSPRPWGGMAHTMLKNIGFSFTMGHRQGKDQAERHLSNGRVHRGLVAGSFYAHTESYRGYQGNKHWNGIIVKHEVKQGNYSLMEVSMSYLLENYL